jgi:muramoyltetrapeptide carboxypeptidase
LDFSEFCRNPKWIVGYSDVTVLHSHINRHYGVPTCHGSMAVNFERDTPEALASLKKALFEGLDAYSFEGKPSIDRPGTARGELIGGNLSILYSLTGTDSFFDPEGKILFIEDLDEYLYHIDRMMQNLRKSGILDRIRGLLVGGLTDMNDNKVPYGKSAETIVAETMEAYDIPVAFGFPAGHMPEQRALYFGVPVELEVGKNNELRFL